MDLYGEELRVWKECWRDQETNAVEMENGIVKETTTGGEAVARTEKMPGSFEW